MTGHRLRLVLLDDPGPQAVADVGGERVDGPLVGVEAHGEPPSLLQPEVAVERGLQVRRLAPVALVPLVSPASKAKWARAR